MRLKSQYTTDEDVMHRIEAVQRQGTVVSGADYGNADGLISQPSWRICRMRFVLLAAVVLLAGCDKPVQKKTRQPHRCQRTNPTTTGGRALEEIRLPGPGRSDARLSETEGNRLEILFEDDSSYRGVVSIPLRAKVMAAATRAVDGMRPT